ncbi:MAG: hypothetical protein JOZ72_05855 [Alphaproteobacteria bacterium]|nr:hypothetical protein [Alphaproteobacteria bacterium]
MVSKYDPLGPYLRRQTADRVPMSFAEVEHVTGVELPAKSQHSRAWWSNNPGNNVMTKVWLDAGFETAEVDLKGRRVVFVRKVMARPKQAAAYAGGMAEDAPEFKPAEEGEKKPRRSPLFGALKGTFWIDPDWDLTKPSLSKEELAAWDASLERKADLWFGKKR